MRGKIYWICNKCGTEIEDKVNWFSGKYTCTNCGTEKDSHYIEQQLIQRGKMNHEKKNKEENEC